MTFCWLVHSAERRDIYPRMCSNSKNVHVRLLAYVSEGALAKPFAVFFNRSSSILTQRIHIGPTLSKVVDQAPNSWLDSLLHAQVLPLKTITSGPLVRLRNVCKSKEGKPY